jgi:hypothetical protein
VLLDDAAARAGRSSTCSRGDTGASRASQITEGDLHRARAGRRLHGRARLGRSRARPGADPPGSPDAAHGERTVSELLDLPARASPDGDLHANNRNTIGALHALAGREQRSRWSASTTSSWPTCWASPWCARTPALLGARAAALAFARLDGDERPPSG